MLTKDLIAMLQKIIDKHKSSGAEEIMGEHETMIPAYEPLCDGSGNLRYIGFSPFIGIEYTSDGVYPMLFDREPTDEEKKAYGIK